MKTSFLSISLLLSSLFLSAQKRELPIRVLDATEQFWISGAPGGRTGTNYSIRVYINTKAPVEFMYVWLGKENVPFNLEQMDLEIQKKIGLGDSVILFSTMVNGEKDPSFEPKRLPIDYKGRALIQCQVNGKARYFIVKQFRKLSNVSGQ